MVALSFSIIEGLGTKVYMVSVMIYNYTIVKVNKQVMYNKKQSFIHTPRIMNPQWSR